MKVDYEQLLSTQNLLNSKINNIVDNLNQIKTTVESLESKEFWAGNGYIKYKEEIEKFISGYLNYLNEFKKINETLSNVVGNYQTVSSQTVEGVQLDLGGGL